MSGKYDKEIAALRAEVEEQTRKMEYEVHIDQMQAKYELALQKKLLDHQAKIVDQAMPMKSEYYSTPVNEWRRDHGDTVADFKTRHGNGFWSQIKICDDDFVFYKLFRGNFLDWALHKLKIKNPKDTDYSNWNYITGQAREGQKLEATLGKTYLEIDEKMKEELEDEEHRKFIKGIAATNPENLKMIAGLKTLDDGMKEPLEDPLNGDSQKVTSGAITVAKQKAMSSAWNANMGSALAANGEEIIRVDPDSTVSFGEKMEKAIKKVMEAPTEDMVQGTPETGKAP
jgi:hypothetical protein